MGNVGDLVPSGCLFMWFTKPLVKKYSILKTIIFMVYSTSHMLGWLALAKQ